MIGRYFANIGRYFANIDEHILWTLTNILQIFANIFANIGRYFCEYWQIFCEYWQAYLANIGRYFANIDKHIWQILAEILRILAKFIFAVISSWAKFWECPRGGKTNFRAGIGLGLGGGGYDCLRTASPPPPPLPEGGVGGRNLLRKQNITFIDISSVSYSQLPVVVKTVLEHEHRWASVAIRVFIKALRDSRNFRNPITHYRWSYWHAPPLPLTYEKWRVTRGGGWEGNLPRPFPLSLAVKPRVHCAVGVLYCLWPPMRLPAPAFR